MHNQKQLLELLATVHRYHIPPPRSTQESLVEYDQRRRRQRNAARGNHRCLRRDGRRGPDDPRVDAPPAAGGRPGAWERQADAAFAAVFRGDAAAVRERLAQLLRIRKQPLLYVALVRGGNPQRIVASRGLQYVLRRLLTYLPGWGC